MCSGCGKAFSEEDGYAHLVECPNTTGTGAQLIRLDEPEEKPKEEAEPKSPKEESEPKKEEEEEAPHSPNPFDNPSESEEEESGTNPFGAPVAVEKKDEAPHSPNPFDNPSESEEEEPKKKEEEEEAPHSPNPFDNPSESEEEEKEVKKEEPEESKKGFSRPKFALNSFMKNATMSISSSLAKLAKEEDDENPDFVCMICGRKLSAERTASHAKHCKAPSGYNGSQFMLLNSDEIKVEKPKEEAEPKSAKEEAEPKKEAEEEEAPHSPNPFDNPSESEEEESGTNPFGAPVAVEKKDEAPHSPNPFDNPSESEEEESGTNPFGAAPVEKKEEAPRSPNPFDNPSESEEEEEEASGTNPFATPVTPASAKSPQGNEDTGADSDSKKKPGFLSSGKKQKSLFGMFSRDKEERKEAASSLFNSITAKVSSTMNNISATVTNIVNTPVEEDPSVIAAREEERIRLENAERERQEELERRRKQQEEEERKRREEEERLRKKNLIKDKLVTGIPCKKHCRRGKPHLTTIILIEHATKGLVVGASEQIDRRFSGTESGSCSARRSRISR